MVHYSYGDIAVLGQERCQGDSLRRAQSLFCILTGWTLGSAGSSPAVSPCVSGAFATSQLGWLCSFFPCVSKSLRLRQTACGLMLHDCVLFHWFYFGTEARGKCWCTGAWPWQMKQGIQELGCALGQGICQAGSDASEAVGEWVLVGRLASWPVSLERGIWKSVASVYGFWTNLRS